MAQENVEVVRDYLRVHVRRSPKEFAEWIEATWDSDGDFYPARKFPDSKPCHGKEEIARYFADWRAAWEQLEFEVRQLIPVGEDRVLAHITMSSEGHGSGAKLEGDLYLCDWLRHGRIFREEHHLTVAGALRALGLEGESLKAAGLRE